VVLVIISGALLQTHFVQNKFKIWIENKTEGQVTIEKLEGIFPFWLRLSKVRYATETIQASFDHVKVTLFPGSLILGRLSISRLQIGSAKISTEGKQWPSFVLPVHIHSMRIDDLTINHIEGLSLSGGGRAF